MNNRSAWVPAVWALVCGFVAMALVTWIVSAPDHPGLESADARFLVVMFGLIGGAMGFAFGSEL